MAFAQFSKISHAFGDRCILKEISLNIGQNTRACLTGANGSGKSTLMKIISGELKADSGIFSVQKNTRIAYLPQSETETEGQLTLRGNTLREEAEKAFAPIKALLAQAEQISAALEAAKSDTAQVRTLLEEHHRLLEQVENSGYYRRDAFIFSVLSGLGFSQEDFSRETGEFSSGWQMRIALAKVLLEQPDILLLDEPTNYLDIESRSWLENWLQKFQGGYLLISHDRYFLDVTVNEVYEIFQGNLKRYTGNYSACEKARQDELSILMKRYAQQQEEIAKTEALIQRFRYKASKAAFAQELIKRLEKTERIEIPENLKKIKINFPPPPHSPKVALTLNGLGKRYGALQVFSGLNLAVDSGERLLVVGPNGAGKTSLLRIISGNESNFEGTVSFGTGIRAGYFSLDTAEDFYGNEKVLECVEAQVTAALMPKVRDMLGAFLFRGDDVFKPVSVLSGGEKSRLALLLMLLKPLNLLILDEPTNHLDIDSKEILLETLQQFKGTIIFVSHDRAFMEALSTKTLELKPSANPETPANIKLFYGDYGYYLEKTGSEPELPLRSLAELPTAEFDLKNNAANAARNALAPLSYAQAHRTQNKKQQKAARQLERREAELLAAIEKLEKEKSSLELELANP
ncbi:MAG: ATP-binding cassette domain-containing protein, partial [Treponema sp.]|nr:ATP-binding cassette domain-containing protein [Treponema sp.]